MASPTGESIAATRITQDGGTNVIGKHASAETGTFLGEISYVRFGSGPENLVILPGITLQNEPPNRIAAWTYRLGFGRFAKVYTVYVINRRRGMLRETAEKIPDATLRIYKGVGHGVPKERKRRYEEDALAFVDDHRGGSSGKGVPTILSRAKEEMR
ncbi:MAG: hypothetical protein H0V21_07885 [Rubrobacter sp.]|nr:hypothetical protein [Rubrobacter sp.]